MPVQSLTSSTVLAMRSEARGISRASCRAVPTGCCGSSAQARINVGASIVANAAGAGRSERATPRSAAEATSSPTSGVNRPGG